MLRRRITKLPLRYTSDSEIPDMYQRLYANINKLSVSQEVKETVKNKVKNNQCDVEELNNFFEQINIASTKSNEDVMADLEGVMQGLNIQRGGNDPLEGNNNVESPASPSTGLALLITAIDQQPIELDQPIAIAQPTKQEQLLGYATQFYNQFITNADECIKYVWNDALKASLGSYVAGKIALITISNPNSLVNFINTLMRTITPYASAGTGILSTVALGTIIKKVVGHYLSNTSRLTREAVVKLNDLNNRVNGMSNEAVVNAIKETSSELSSAIEETISSLKQQDKNALADLLPEIDANLNIEDKKVTGDVIVGQRKKKYNAKGVRRQGDMDIEGATTNVATTTGTHSSPAATVFNAPTGKRPRGEMETDTEREAEEANRIAAKAEPEKLGDENLDIDNTEKDGATEGGKRKSKKRRITKKKKHIKRKATKKKKYSKSKTKRKVHKKK
jgi:hypothetical protein